MVVSWDLYILISFFDLFGRFGLVPVSCVRVEGRWRGLGEVLLIDSDGGRKQYPTQFLQATCVYVDSLN